MSCSSARSPAAPEKPQPASDCAVLGERDRAAVLRLDQGIARGQLHAAVGSLSGTALSDAQQGCPQQQTRAQQHRAGKFRFSPRHQRPPFVFFSLSHSAWRRHRREEKSM